MFNTILFKKKEKIQKINKKVNLKNITAIAIIIVFAFLLIFNLIIIIKGTLNQETPPSILGITPMVVLSDSMSGNSDNHIEVGDLIFVVKEKTENLKVGDVIAYTNSGTIVTHRIINIETIEGNKIFTTKGDNNELKDDISVTEEQIIGIYRIRIPKVWNMVKFLQQPLVMLIFIGGPLIAFIIYDILRRQRYARIERKKIQEIEDELSKLRTLNEKNNPQSKAKSSDFLE